MFHQQLTNLGSGATLGTGFYRPFRLIDNDGFYVDIYNTPPAVPYAYSSPAPGDAFYNEITWATNMGIYKGTKGGDSGPSVVTSRKEAAAVLYRFSHPRWTPDPTCSGSTRMFSDVPSSLDECGAIEGLATAEIIQGYDDGTYKPGNYVSRQAMAAFLFRLKAPPGISTTCTGTTRMFPDVPATNGFCAQIEWLVARGVINGYDDGLFKPTNNITRQAGAAFVYRASKL